MKAVHSSSTADMSATNVSRAKVLVVGQLYQDFILHVDEFPAEDAKKRASELEIRSGGNCGNTLRVLSQLPNVDTYCMSSLGPKEEAGYEEVGETVKNR